jgi:hypothetical protein
MIKIIYNSPAVPQKPYDFDLNKEYDMDKINGKYFIYRDKDNKQEFGIDFIKSMFKPCEGYSWDMLENKNENKIKKTKSKQCDTKKSSQELI